MHTLRDFIVFYIYMIISGLYVYPIAHKYKKIMRSGGYIPLRLITMHILPLISMNFFFTKTVSMKSISFYIFIGYAIAGLTVFILYYKKNPDKEFLKRILIYELISFITIWLYLAFLKVKPPREANDDTWIDLMFMNSIYRSDYLPANDAWYWGTKINYIYYYMSYFAVYMSRLLMIDIDNIANIVNYVGLGIALSIHFSFIIDIFYNKLKRYKWVLFILVLIQFYLVFSISTLATNLKIDFSIFKNLGFGYSNVFLYDCLINKDISAQEQSIAFLFIRPMFHSFNISYTYIVSFLYLMYLQANFNIRKMKSVILPIFIGINIAILLISDIYPGLISLAISVGIYILDLFMDFDKHKLKTYLINLLMLAVTTYGSTYLYLKFYTIGVESTTTINYSRNNFFSVISKWNLVIIMFLISCYMLYKIYKYNIINISSKVNFQILTVISLVQFLTLFVNEYVLLTNDYGNTFYKNIFYAKIVILFFALYMLYLLYQHKLYKIFIILFLAISFNTTKSESLDYLLKLDLINFHKVLNIYENIDYSINKKLFLNEESYPLDFTEKSLRENLDMIRFLNSNYTRDKQYTLLLPIDDKKIVQGTAAYDDLSLYYSSLTGMQSILGRIDFTSVFNFKEKYREPFLYLSAYKIYQSDIDYAKKAIKDYGIDFIIVNKDVYALYDVDIEKLSTLGTIVYRKGNNYIIDVAKNK